MTNKFNVGDKVEFIEDFGEYKEGDVVEITGTKNIKKDWYLIRGEHGRGDVFGKRLKLLKSKPTKNQRITTLEETVAKQGEEIEELKLIVAQICKPSTVVEEALANDIIEFEGKQYKKVDREAREGDVVVFTSIPHYNPYGDVKVGKPYKAHEGSGLYKKYFYDDVDFKTHIYGGGLLNGTPETVDVYELMDGYNPGIVMVEETTIKTANQLRGEIIEKAKAFVDCTATDDTHFEINGNQVLAWRIIRKGTGYDALTGVAVCSPNDVFNEDIGRAISVGRLEGLDVSEFEQAVQPTEQVIGHIVTREDGYVQEVKQLNYDKSLYKIINDTNAQYGGAE